MALRINREPGIVEFAFDRKETLVLMNAHILIPADSTVSAANAEDARITAENEQEVEEVLGWLSSLGIQVQYLQ